MPPTESKRDSDPIAAGPDYDYKPSKVGEIKQAPHVPPHKPPKPHILSHTRTSSHDDVRVRVVKFCYARRRGRVRNAYIHSTCDFGEKRRIHDA